MKYVVARLMATLDEREVKQNLRPLLRYMVLLAAVVVAFSVAFHVLMVWEGQQHSWLTGFYWTLTVMSTLGFGDITFHTDLGRLFSIAVLLTGILMLLIVLPFAFIRYFYAPWMRAQLRLGAPRTVSRSLSGHVVVARLDAVAYGLVERLRLSDVRCVVLEADPEEAARLHDDGVPVVAGDLALPETRAGLRLEHARYLVANLDDAANTNITLAVREQAPTLPVAALVEDDDAVDILELSGADHVVPVKQLLGQQLAARVSAGRPKSLVIGRLHDLLVAEFPVAGTPAEGVLLRDSRLRELTGVNVVACYERAQVRPVSPDLRFSASSVAIVVGTRAQLDALDRLYEARGANDAPVLVIGGGKVGRAATVALRQRGIRVHLLDREPALRSVLEPLADKVFIGDAAQRSVIEAAGVHETPTVLLTTRDDATNIYLAVYCRRLNPETRIVSRIMLDRNLAAMNRAGADFVLGQTSLAVRSMLAAIRGRELVVVGEELDVFVVSVPALLRHQTLAESGIGARTGLSVIGVERGGAAVRPLPANVPLEPDWRLVMLGTTEQRRAFEAAFPPTA